MRHPTVFRYNAKSSVLKSVIFSASASCEKSRSAFARSRCELAQALIKQGHELSPRTMGRLLNGAGFSLQENRKTRDLGRHEVTVVLIANTRTRAGLKIPAELDIARYPTGTKVNDEELAAINLKRHEFLATGITRYRRHDEN